MRLTGYPTSCLTFAVTLVKTTRQQRETLPIAGFANVLDVWRHFLDQRDPFAAEGRFEWRKTSHVAPGP